MRGRPVGPTSTTDDASSTTRERDGNQRARRAATASERERRVVGDRAHRGTGTDADRGANGVVGGVALELRLGAQLQPVAQHGGRDGDDVVGDDEPAAGEPGRGLGRGEEMHRGARARTERDARQLACPAHQRDDVADDCLAHGRRVDQRARRRAASSGAGDRAARRRGSRARRRRWREAQHRGLVGALGIADVELGEEAVELRFGQRDRCPRTRSGSASRRR